LPHAAILLISSDLPEILHLTNRTYVMYRGEQRAELEGAHNAGLHFGEFL
jgi:ribose transport system ATP-binding protein